MPEAPPAATPAGESPAQLAARHGLRLVGVRPPLDDYLRRIWARRYFVLELARAREQSETSGSRLGRLWQVLNPLLNVGVYWIVFGVLLKVNRSVPNYLSFLVIGVFVFTFTQSSAMSGSRAITHSMGLVRALHFPRAILPLAAVLEELFPLATALVICAAVALLQGE